MYYRERIIAGMVLLIEQQFFNKENFHQQQKCFFPVTEAIFFESITRDPIRTKYLTYVWHFVQPITEGTFEIEI